jgi:hypothetical protein
MKEKEGTGKKRKEKEGTPRDGPVTSTTKRYVCVDMLSHICSRVKPYREREKPKDEAKRAGTVRRHKLESEGTLARHPGLNY